MLTQISTFSVFLSLLSFITSLANVHYRKDWYLFRVLFQNVWHYLKFLGTFHQMSIFTLPNKETEVSCVEMNSEFNMRFPIHQISSTLLWTLLVTDRTESDTVSWVFIKLHLNFSCLAINWISSCVVWFSTMINYILIEVWKVSYFWAIILWERRVFPKLLVIFFAIDLSFCVVEGKILKMSVHAQL